MAIQTDGSFIAVEDETSVLTVDRRNCTIRTTGDLVENLTDADMAPVLPLTPVESFGPARARFARFVSSRRPIGQAPWGIDFAQFR